MSETTKEPTKKSDLKLFGEIERRVTECGEKAKALLVAALEDGITVAELRLIEQVVERYDQLTEKGQEYVDGTLGVQHEPPRA